MKKILAEISLGELADKITILEIKMKKIVDKESLNIMNKEYQSLKAIDLKDINLNKYKQLFNELKSINEKLWDIENEKRLLEKIQILEISLFKFQELYILIMIKEQKLKLKINKSFGSNIEEVKEYTKY